MLTWTATMRTATSSRSAPWSSPARRTPTSTTSAPSWSCSDSAGRAARREALLEPGVEHLLFVVQRVGGARGGMARVVHVLHPFLAAAHRLPARLQRVLELDL